MSLTLDHYTKFTSEESWGTKRGIIFLKFIFYLKQDSLVSTLYGVSLIHCFCCCFYEACLSPCWGQATTKAKRGQISMIKRILPQRDCWLQWICKVAVLGNKEASKRPSHMLACCLSYFSIVSQYFVYNHFSPIYLIIFCGHNVCEFTICYSLELKGYI